MLLRSTSDNCLVCIARRLPPNERPPGLPVEQFTTKLSTDGAIVGVDFSGLSAKWVNIIKKVGYLSEFNLLTATPPDNNNLIKILPQDNVLSGGSLLQELCHLGDLPKLDSHLRETLQGGSSTSLLYRLRLSKDRTVQVQTKSKFFAFNNQLSSDFIMATHTILNEPNTSNQQQQQQSGEESSDTNQQPGHHQDDMGSSGLGHHDNNNSSSGLDFDSGSGNWENSNSNGGGSNPGDYGLADWMPPPPQQQQQITQEFSSGQLQPQQQQQSSSSDKLRNLLTSKSENKILKGLLNQPDDNSGGGESNNSASSGVGGGGDNNNMLLKLLNDNKIHQQQQQVIIRINLFTFVAMGTFQTLNQFV